MPSIRLGAATVLGPIRWFLQICGEGAGHIYGVNIRKPACPRGAKCLWTVSLRLIAGYYQFQRVPSSNRLTGKHARL